MARENEELSLSLFVFNVNTYLLKLDAAVGILMGLHNNFFGAVEETTLLLSHKANMFPVRERFCQIRNEVDLR